MEGLGCQLVQKYRSGAHPNGTFDMLVQALVDMISSCTCRHGGGYGACALDTFYMSRRNLRNSSRNLDISGSARFELCFAFFWTFSFSRNFDIFGKYKSEIVRNSQKSSEIVRNNHDFSFAWRFFRHLFFPGFLTSWEIEVRNNQKLSEIVRNSQK